MDIMQFLDMLLHVDKTMGTIVAQYGTLVYAVLFAIIFSETGLVVMAFLPGDTLLFVAGALCATGQMNLFALATLLVVAAVLGNTTNYWIGSAVGHRIVASNTRWVNQAALKRTHSFFERHGGKTIILARFVPLVRTFAPFVAGMSDMTFAKFQFYNITGALLWVLSLTIAGYFFGNIPLIRDHLNTIVLIGIGAAVVPLALGGVWRAARSLARR